MASAAAATTTVASKALADACEASATLFYHKVAEGASEAGVRAALSSCRSLAGLSGGLSLSAAVNRFAPEMPLRAADRFLRCDLVRLLLDAGAEPSVGFSKPYDNKVALSIKHGLSDTMRALLRAGVNGGDANARIPNHDKHPSCFCTAMHLCVDPPTPEKLDCLKVLVKEFGGDVDARDDYLCTPLYYLADAELPPHVHNAAIDLLLELGADLEARNKNDDTLLLDGACYCPVESIRI
jgi:ankyrin repeat protein